MRLGRRPEAHVRERFALRLSAGAGAGHEDEAVPVERAAKGSLYAGTCKDGPAAIEAAEEDRVELARLSGHVLRACRLQKREEEHRARSHAPSRPCPHEHNPHGRRVAF
jgi:hypothetical protein